MDKYEYLNIIEKSKLNMDKINLFVDKYGVKLGDYISKVISVADDSVFIEDERRVLSLDEMLTLDEDFACDFYEMKIIPVIDCFDNDYIVYIIDEDKWGKYSISDDVIFDKKDTLEEVI